MYNRLDFYICKNTNNQIDEIEKIVYQKRILEILVIEFILNHY